MKAFVFVIFVLFGFVFFTMCMIDNEERRKQERDRKNGKK